MTHHASILCGQMSIAMRYNHSRSNRETHGDNQQSSGKGSPGHWGAASSLRGVYSSITPPPHTIPRADLHIHPPPSTHQPMPDGHHPANDVLVYTLV